MKASYELLPYVEIDGCWTFTDTFIKGLYRKMETDNDLPDTFLDGSVQSDQDLVDRFKRYDHKFFIVPDKDSLKAVLWLSDFRQATAYAHFWVAKEFRGGVEAVHMANRFLEEMLYMEDPTNRYVFDVIFAYVSNENEGVVRLLKGLYKMSEQDGSILDGKVLGVIPNAMIDVYKKRPVNAILGYATRKEVIL